VMVGVGVWAQLTATLVWLSSLRGDNTHSGVDGEE